MLKGEVGGLSVKGCCSTDDPTETGVALQRHSVWAMASLRSSPSSFLLSCVSLLSYSLSLAPFHPLLSTHNALDRGLTSIVV